MRLTAQWWCTLVVMMLMTGTVGAEVVLDSTPADTGASTVLMWASGQDWTLVDPKTGLEAVAPSVGSRRTSSGGTIEWRVVRDETDELGMRHVFYEQGFQPARGSVTLPSMEAGDVVPLHGGGLGFHYAPDGRVKVVGGALFEDVAAVDGLALVTPESAREMAEWAMRNGGEVAVATLDELGAALAASLRERTTLSLRSTGDGRSFEFVWVVPMITAEGRSLETAIHGRTGDLLAVWDPNPTFDGDAKILTLPGCNEGSAASTSARVVPQNSNITYTRAFKASAATDLHAYYGGAVTHEGRRPLDSQGPEIVSYFGVYTDQDQCPDMDETQYFRRLPVKTVSLQRRYDNFFDLDEPVPGRAAGDGGYKAYQTLSTFKNLGWNGLSKVNIVANSYGCLNNAAWWRNADELAPGDSVVFCRISTDYDRNFVADTDGHFLHSAALDMVGHELGHAMLFNTTAWAYEGPYDTGEDLHEGWADVLGLISEWSNEASGSGYEKADWLLGEDIFLNLNPIRRVDSSADDGAAPGGPYSLHASDPPATDPYYPYYRGIRIPLAFRLAVTGGYNPVCGRLWVGGCENPDGVDLRPFDEVAKIFFRTVQYYAGANQIETFNDIVYYASVAAHDLFWLDDSSSPPACTDGAIQQHTVREAFEAVGHPAAGGFICTCQPNCDIYEW